MCDRWILLMLRSHSKESLAIRSIVRLAGERRLRIRYALLWVVVSGRH